MSNDDRLTRRNDAIPVSVRRPPAIDPSLLPPPAGPPAAPNPHIIYINNNIPPAAAPVVTATAPAPGPIPAPPPAEIHHHHHYAAQNTSHRISYRIPAPPSHSALGTAALALGIIACVVCWVPWLGLVAVPVGAIGAVLGALGVVVSLLFRKSSAALPLTAVFVCCLAAGISIASTRTLPYWQQQLQRVIATVDPALATQLHSTGTSVAPTPPPTPPPSLPANWLNLGSTAAPSPAPPVAPNITPSNAPQPSPAHPAIVPKLDPAVAAALNQLTAAEKACDQRTMQTPEYQAAVKAAADARSRQASADPLQAGQAMIQADNAVTELLSNAQANDPQVAAARQALAAARAAAAR